MFERVRDFVRAELRACAQSAAAALLTLALCGSCVPAARAAQTTLVASGSTWKYLDNGSNQGTAWRASAFNDSTWASGPAQLGYGDGDEATVVSYGPNASAKFITTYLRRTFPVADASAVQSLTLEVLRDDGAVVYLNGVEVFRSNMPTGTIGYTTRASSALGSAAESTWLTGTFNPALLVAGTNVIAVEIHQDGPDSRDISFNLELTASLSAQAQAASTTQTTTASAPKRTSFFSVQMIEKKKEDELLI
jgi:acid phosphatase type 7